MEDRGPVKYTSATCLEFHLTFRIAYRAQSVLDHPKGWKSNVKPLLRLTGEWVAMSSLSRNKSRLECMFLCDGALDYI